MWSEDISAAQLLEEKLCELLRKNYSCKSVITSSSIVGIDVSFPAWDIKVEFEDGTELLIELKQDKLADTTGNVAVEFCRIINGEIRQTGLAVTDATVWVQYFNNTFHAVKTETLRKMAANREYSRIQAGGDKGYARFYLFPVETYKNRAIVIN